MRGLNVCLAQGISLDFIFQHSSLSLERRSPCNISRAQSTGLVASGRQLPCCALAKAKATDQASQHVVLGRFEFFGPRGGSILSFKNSIFMVTN